MDRKTFCEQLKKEKEEYSYTVLAWKYGVNRKFLWGLIKNPNCRLPKSVSDKLGFDLPRARRLRPPATEIRKDDAAIAAAQIGRNCHFKVTDLIVELSKQLPEETVKELKERL